jgi:hypothetical protein
MHGQETLSDGHDAPAEEMVARAVKQRRESTVALAKSRFTIDQPTDWFAPRMASILCGRPATSPHAANLAPAYPGAWREPRAVAEWWRQYSINVSLPLLAALLKPRDDDTSDDEQPDAADYVDAAGDMAAPSLRRAPDMPRDPIAEPFAYASARLELLTRELTHYDYASASGALHETAANLTAALGIRGVWPVLLEGPFADHFVRIARPVHRPPITMWADDSGAEGDNDADPGGDSRSSGSIEPTGGDDSHDAVAGAGGGDDDSNDAAVGGGSFLAALEFFVADNGAVGRVDANNDDSADEHRSSSFTWVVDDRTLLAAFAAGVWSAMMPCQGEAASLARVLSAHAVAVALLDPTRAEHEYDWFVEGSPACCVTLTLASQAIDLVESGSGRSNEPFGFAWRKAWAYRALAKELHAHRGSKFEPRTVVSVAQAYAYDYAAHFSAKGSTSAPDAQDRELLAAFADALKAIQERDERLRQATAESQSRGTAVPLSERQRREANEDAPMTWANAAKEGLTTYGALSRGQPGRAPLEVIPPVVRLWPIGDDAASLRQTLAIVKLAQGVQG